MGKRLSILLPLAEGTDKTTLAISLPAYLLHDGEEYCRIDVRKGDHYVEYKKSLWPDDVRARGVEFKKRNS